MYPAGDTPGQFHLVGNLWWPKRVCPLPGLGGILVSDGYHVALLGLPRGEVLRRFDDGQGDGGDFAVSPDGSKVVVIGFQRASWLPAFARHLLERDSRERSWLYMTEHRLSMFDLRTGKRLWRHTFLREGFNNVAFSPDGSQVGGLSTRKDSVQATLWRAKDGHELRRWKVPGGATALAFTKEAGAVVQVQTDSGGTEFWSLSQGARLCMVSAGHLAVNPISGQIFGLAYFGRGIERWNLPDGRRVLPSWTQPWGSAPGLAVSPDGQWLAMGGYSDHPPGLWNLATGESLPIPTGTAPVDLRTLGWSPDSRWLALAGLDRNGVVIVDLKSTQAALTSPPVQVQAISPRSMDMP